MTNLKQKRFVDTDYLKEQLDSTAIEVEGSHITATETKIGAIQDLEILGNTVQDPNNLADIKSVGELQEDGTYKMSISSCGKNLITGELKHSVTDVVYCENVFLNKNVKYTITPKNVDIVNSHIAISKNTNHNDPLQRISDFTENIRTFSLNDTLESGYYNLVFWKAGISNTENGFIQLEEGTVATPYEPYQGNKCDILLPCQLEKVGDVSDRLYYDDVEKAWCIEKNIGNVVLNGSERTGVFNTNATLTNYIQIIHPGMKLVNNTPIILSTFKNENYSSSKDYEYGYSWVINGESCIYLNFLKSKGNTDSEFKTWLSQNPTLVKYQLATPQKIILPLDVQIQLNSFFGTTHIYMESGEVEGTIKCKVPKSLGATVQSLNNKTDILSDRIEAIEGLKDSQNMKYETDKGYLVCKETKNGVIDDLKIEGKTLVNLVDNLTSIGRGYTYDTLTKVLKGTSSGVDDWSWGDIPSIFNIKADTEYTLVFNGITSNTILAVRSYDEIEDVTVNPCVIGLNVIKFTSSGTNFKLKIYDVNRSTQVSISHLMLLEGDHTQNPPSYFEGLMSVGQDVDKIEVLSVKGDGNLFSGKPVKGYLDPTGVISPHDNWVVEYNYIPVESNCTITISEGLYCGKCIVVYYDKNLNAITSSLNINANGSHTVTTPSNCKYIRVAGCKNPETASTTEEIKNIKFMINKGTTPKPYTPHQSDKKQILFYNENGELEPIQELHEWDSIEKHSDNKWYYHKRSGKVVLNGSENNIGISTTHNTVQRFIYTGMENITYSEVICDKFSSYDDDESFGDVEGICARNNNTGFNIHISKSKLSTQDIEGFKQWLSENNVTVVYQLAREEVYECIDLGVNSYEGETLVQVNSGVICPQNLAFSTQKHIGNIVNKLQERVDKNTKFREELTENMTYTETIEQGKGYTVIENSKEGVVTVPEIKGKTLVNLCQFKDTQFTLTTGEHYNDLFICYTDNLKLNTNYTFMYDIEIISNTTGAVLGTNVFNQFGVSNSDIEYTTNHPSMKINGTTTVVMSQLKNHNRALIQFIDFKGYKALRLRPIMPPIRPLPEGQSITYKVKNMILLEGDHTQNPPSYFEGLKSVGEDVDEIVVSSANKNLLNEVEAEGYYRAYVNGVLTENKDYNSVKGKVEPNTRYVLRTGGEISNSISNLCFLDKNFKFIKGIGNSVFDFTTPMNCRYIMIAVPKTHKEVQLESGDTPTKYIPPQSDKKQILFYNTETQTWEKPILREWDSIEKHSDGKYYYHQRSEEVVLNGSEGWVLGSEIQFTETHMYFACNSFDSIIKASSLISDKFENKPTWDTLSRECIDSVTSSYKLRIRLAKSKLSTQDVTGFKQWLQANNVTVVYQLAEEKVYECTNIDLNSYNGETNVIVESGAIVPQTTVKVQNNLQEIIRNLKNRVRQLEEEIYNYKVTQNLRQLRTFYKSDYANFGVATLNNYSIEPTNIAITPYGYDLFEIFKEVIAQGKDKYDRIELEEYIDFYLMTFVFDFDMVFELFDLLDANEDIIEDEPVEEEPPTEEEEDVVEDTPTILPNLPEDEATPIPLI